MLRAAGVAAECLKVTSMNPRSELTLPDCSWPDPRLIQCQWTSPEPLPAVNWECIVQPWVWLWGKCESFSDRVLVGF